MTPVDPTGPDDPVGLEHGSHTGWTVVSYLLTGMVFYGGIGWLLGRLLDVPMLFPVGMLVGLALSTAMIIFRYGRL